MTAYSDANPPNGGDTTRPPRKCISTHRHKPDKSPRPTLEQPENKHKIILVIPPKDNNDKSPAKDNENNTASDKNQDGGGDQAQNRQGKEADQSKGLRLLNEILQEKGLSALKFSATVELAALRHSQYLVANS
ncbi:hypothetical protein IWQ61_002415 [Dispira simplex]|nr:hypothetical protein IWQ61_002415 [Dispira simplex]